MTRPPQQPPVPPRPGRAGRPPPGQRQGRRPAAGRPRPAGQHRSGRAAGPSRGRQPRASSPAGRAAAGRAPASASLGRASPGRRSPEPRSAARADRRDRPAPRPAPGPAQRPAGAAPAGPAGPAGSPAPAPAPAGPASGQRPASERPAPPAQPRTSARARPPRAARPAATLRLGRVIRRLWTSVFFVGLLLAVVLVRLVWLQGMDAGGYALAASDEKREFVTLHAARGSILDRNGVPLAYTADAKDIVADPTMIKPTTGPTTPPMLAPLLGKRPIDVARAARPPPRTTRCWHRAVAGGGQADRGPDAATASRWPGIFSPGHPAAALPGPDHRLQRGRPGAVRRRRRGRHRVQLRLAAARHRRLGQLREGLGRQRQPGRPDQAQGRAWTAAPSG